MSAGMLLPGTNGGSNGGAAAALTLPDGRLRVGTHLARRYRYLSTLGEGVSAQVGCKGRGTCLLRLPLSTLVLMGTSTSPGAPNAS